AAVRAAPPGARVQLVDGERCAPPVALRACRHPVAVLPRVPAVHDDAGRGRPQLAALGVRIRFQEQRARGAVADLELVHAFVEPRHEQLPDAARAEVAHGVAAAVPAVEVPDDAHALRVRRPYGEQRAGDAVERPRVGAQEFLGPGVLPGVEVPEVLLPDRRPERPGLVAYPARALAVL